MSSDSRLRTGVDPEDHVRGAHRAPITIVEYGDFECRESGAAYFKLRALPTEHFRLVFRHFPITQAHPRALVCAEASEAAAAQGQFWALHDALFENQDELGDAALWAYAAEAGLDLDHFIDALNDHRHQARVERDCMSGVLHGITRTPWFFVNGHRLDAPIESVLELAGLSQHDYR